MLLVLLSRTGDVFIRPVISARSGCECRVRTEKHFASVPCSHLNANRPLADSHYQFIQEARLGIEVNFSQFNRLLERAELLKIIQFYDFQASATIEKHL